MGNQSSRIRTLKLSINTALHFRLLIPRRLHLQH